MRLDLFITRIALALGMLGLIGVGMGMPRPVQAAVGINKTLNVQGRLQDKTGAVVPDGTYNVEFKIYQDGTGATAGDPGGTLKWTEDWVYGPGSGGGWADNRLIVKNGYFSVALGSICSMAATTCTANNGNAQTNTVIDFNQDTLWLSMNIGNTTQAASFAAASGDGEMVPMRRLGSAVYALQADNANKFGGLTSSQLLQLGTGSVQTDTSTNAAVFLNKTGASGNILTLRKNGTDAFDVDNTGNLLFGSNADKTVQIAQAAASTAGNKLTVAAGQGGTGTGSAGGKLVLQGGAAGGTAANGGDVLVYGGAKAGSGTNGNVSLAFDGTSAVGTVGVGKAASSSFALDVNGAVNSSSTISATTSVTAPQFSSSGAVTVQSGAGNLTVTAASDNLLTNATTIQRVAAGTTTLDLVDASNTTLNITNSGAGVANLTLEGAATIPGANALTLGTTGTNTGAVLFKGSTAASGTLTLQGPTNPSTSNFTLNIPAISASANLCTDNAGCTGYHAAPASGSYVQTIPTTALQNTIAPATASVVALTVNGTSSTAAQAMIVNQAQGADAANINVTGSSQTNGLSIIRTNAGTLTNALAITNTSGTVTNGLAFSGTIGTDISRVAGTVLTIQGTSGMTVTAGGTTTLAADTGGSGTVNFGNTNATTINIGSVAATTTARTTTIAGGNSGVVDTVNIGTGNTTVAGGKTVHIADGTPTFTTPSVTIGNSANTSNDSGKSGLLGATKVTTGASGGTLMSINVLFNTAPVTGHAKVALYADSAGTPGALIASSPEYTVTGSSTNQFPLKATISSSTTYWLALKLDSDDINYGLELGVGSNTNAYVTAAYSSAFPSSFGTATRDNNKWDFTMTYAPSVGSNQVTIGSLANASSTTIQGGTGNITLTTNQAAAGTTVKSQTNNSAAVFQIQNAAGTGFFTADSSKAIITSTDLDVGSAANAGSATRLFSDGFENGGLGAWSGGTNLSGTATITLDSLVKRNGKYSAKFGINPGPAQLTTAIKGGTTTVARAYVNMAEQVTGDFEDIIALQTPGGWFLAYRDNTNGNIGIWNDYTATFITGSTYMSVNAWHKIELAATINATTGSVTAYMDGVSVAAMTNVNTGTVNPINLVLGDANATRSGGVENFDDVSVDTVQPGDSASLNVADSLHVGGSTTLGQTWVQPGSNSTATFQVLNASGVSQLNVDTTNSSVSILGSAPGETTSWTTSANPIGQPTPAARYGGASVMANGYIYIIGGNDGAAVRSEVYYSKVNGDGSNGTWATTTALPAIRQRETAVFYNGYIYVIGGHNGSFQSTIYYAKTNSDGTLGAWVTASNPIGNPTPVLRANNLSVVASGYLYVIGGQDGVTNALSTVYFAKLNSDGSVGTWSTTNSMPGPRYFGNGVVANGYIYYVGGKDLADASQSQVYYGQVNPSTGAVTWNTDTTHAFPTTIVEENTLVSNGYMYLIGGGVASPQTAVYYTKLKSDGTLGGWTQSSNALPAGRQSSQVVTANGYLYELGGFNVTAQSTVYYTSTARLQVGANLDLVGGLAQDLVDTGDIGASNTGGSLTAGDGTFAGALSVRGMATIAGAAAVDGVTMASGGLTVGGGFSTTDTTQANFNLDSRITFAETAGTCSATVNGGALYYNSAQAGATQGGSGAIRACINGAWEDLVSTAGLGLWLFGVVPDSGPTAGDQIGITGYTNSACKVTRASTTTVNVANCVAYSGGRKVVLSGLSALTAFSAASSWYHICLNGTNNAPAKTTANASQTANLPAFSAGNPVLCIADVQTGAGSTITNIYDTRTFTTSTKQFATINSAVTPGMVVRYNSAGTTGTVETVAVANSTVVAGVVAAASGTASTNTINGIIVTSGLTFVKALAAATFGNTVTTSATAGYVTNGTTANSMLGTSMKSQDAGCTAATDCQFSEPVQVKPH
jgi:hypothetical protein